ncbi:hypothetical protein [Candidatus Nitrospira nitrificans]|uniref:Uncharacterized protein n=1 Tax=Candidatus Nitrospira nitrificans TaxID=1742973 RepID=A0A0S4L1D2_9BACT|nr:hypothetical protein [Candidatus Nitrospira nitrificans]CUS31335.1 hypothetical protein COMA2_10049 [Candidatus Nitrospira nitrificans]
MWVLLTILIVFASMPERSSHAMSAQELTKSVSILKKKAGSGMVRVIVKVRPSSAQREIESAKANIAKVMRQEGAPVVEPLEGQPLIVMELSADQLDRLIATGLVESIQEDRIDRAF